MDKKSWIIRLFLAFFTLSVSVTVIPCGVINTYGLFGETTASFITEDKEQTIANETAKSLNRHQKVKGSNIFNIWFEILVLVICIRFITYLIKLPRGDTIITLKVRMDN